MITESLEDKEMPLLEITDERMSDVFKFQTQKLYRFLMNEFIDSFPVFFSGGLFCFDGFAILYSFSPLSSVSKKLKLSTQKCANIMKENCQILLNIKPSADYFINLKNDIEQGRQFLKAAVLNSALQNP
uniref:Uncharacterized protein n=1 Tax=Panagrolaimus davidi TaxID=227884 RepID=A0A914NZL9_9BILA